MSAAGRRVGRFLLHEELGRGAQATVWRAHDERLDREVALKLPTPGAAAIDIDAWLHEARAVGRLHHPHIVPVFEADDIGGQPALVFELVRGGTLSQRLKRGALAAGEAVPLMLGVLDALQAAHAQGIVHRDLKPSNILLDSDGRARVMDFGIAARIGGPDDGRIVGTPGYMSPEAARGAAPVPAMDVFAATLVLAELLLGHRLVAERDPWAAVERVRDRPLELPASPAIDDRLRAALERGLAHDAALRWPSAAALREALAAWLKPAGGAGGEGAPGGHGTLDFLLRRMRHRSDFPALSDAMVRIQRVASSEHENLHRLSEEILKDVALTHKLLRLVNSAAFGGAGGGIGTVSRAVALIGFAGIRNMALSLVLLEHMQNKTHAARLRERYLQALMAGQLANQLTPSAREGEEAFLGALLRHLGALLSEFYFPEEATAVRELMQAGRDVDAASVQVLGLSYEALGVGVARAWGLPEPLQRVMRRPEGPPPARRLPAGLDRHRWLASAANEAAEAVLLSEEGELPQRLGAIAERHAAALGHDTRDWLEAVAVARGRLGEMASAMGLTLGSKSAARRLIAAPEPATVVLAADAPTLRLDAAPAPAAAEALAAGIQEVTHTLAADDFRLNEVLHQILETIFRALAFRRVVFALRDPRQNSLCGRFGLGEGADVVARAMRVPLGTQGADLFTAVCRKGADMLIADAGAANIASRLPGWFREQVNAPSFLLLPMAMKGAPFALIYADKAAAGSIQLGEKELALLRTLRNQAVVAFRQAA